MKKICIILSLSILLIGCQNQIQQNAIETVEETLEEIDKSYELTHDLDLEFCIGDLVFEKSSCWQFMTDKLDSKLIENFEKWSYSYIPDYNTSIVIGYEINELYKKDFKVNDVIEKLIPEKCGYAHIDTFNYNNYDNKGYLFDIIKDNVAYRTLFILDDGVLYKIISYDGDGIIPSTMLQFFYDYCKNVRIVKV